MENRSSNYVEASLIKHRLLSCKSETKIEPSTSEGGRAEIVVSFEHPKTPNILKKNESFEVKIQLEITGKVKDSTDIAFNASCKMLGTYKLINCHKNGIPTKDGSILWSLSTSQLWPLVAQFTSDIVSRMGYKNFNIPPFIPSDFSPIAKPKKITPKKIKS